MNNKFLVLDTNIILLDANNILTLGKDYTIVLPEMVLDELEAKKNSDDPNLRYQVREFGRIITKETNVTIGRKGSMTIVRSILENGTILETASKEKYNITSKIGKADSMIIEIAKDYEDIHKDVLLMTNDVLCSKRALSKSIKTTSLKLVNNDITNFTKTLELNSEVFSVLTGSITV